MKRPSKNCVLVLVAFTLLAGGTALYSQAQTQDQAPRPAPSRADETLEIWNAIGNKLVAMAEDFPEDKYDFKLQKDERTFAENLLHVAAVDYDLMRAASGSKIGPDFGKNKHNPSRDDYKTKADVVKLIQQAVADGAKLIQEQRRRVGQNDENAVGKPTCPQFLHLDVRDRAQRRALRSTRSLLSGEQFGTAGLATVTRGISLMKQERIFSLLAVLIFTAAVWVRSTESTSIASTSQAQQAQQPPQTVASSVERQRNTVEKLIVDAADAMPEDKFNFSPESLNIPGADYKGVRTFAGQVKHASNYFIWSPVTGDKLPAGLKDGNGPEDLKTKSEVMKFLKDSFALGHRAAAMLTTENNLQIPENSKSTRLYLTTFGVAHAYDHYGQMVEYLRMNGIVPPASRGKSD